MGGDKLMLDHLRAAQADALRFHGRVPVRAWQPAPDRRAWLAGGAAALAVAAALALAWPGADHEPVTVVAGLDGQRDTGPVRPAAPPAIRTQAASQGAPAVAPAPAEVRAEAPLADVVAGPAPLPYEPPADPEDWALHPPMAPEPAVLPGLRPLYNTPELPDDTAVAPAGESAAEDDVGGGHDDSAPGPFTGSQPG